MRIPRHKADDLGKILGLPPSNKPKKESSEENRIEGRPDPHADITDPMLKEILDDTLSDFDSRDYWFICKL